MEMLEVSNKEDAFILMTNDLLSDFFLETSIFGSDLGICDFYFPNS